MSDFPKGLNFIPDEVRKVLAGDTDALWRAFIWDVAPWGGAFWKSQAKYGLSSEGRARLQAMLDEYEGKPAPVTMPDDPLKHAVGCAAFRGRRCNCSIPDPGPIRGMEDPGCEWVAMPDECACGHASWCGIHKDTDRPCSCGYEADQRPLVVVGSREQSDRVAKADPFRWINHVQRLEDLAYERDFDFVVYGLGRCTAAEMHGHLKIIEDLRWRPGARQISVEEAEGREAAAARFREKVRQAHEAALGRLGPEHVPTVTVPRIEGNRRADVTVPARVHENAHNLALDSGNDDAYRMGFRQELD